MAEPEGWLSKWDSLDRRITISVRYIRFYIRQNYLSPWHVLAIIPKLHCQSFGGKE
jgi:hypothetical protein